MRSKVKQAKSLDIVGPSELFSKTNAIRILKSMIPVFIKDRLHNKFAEITKKRILSSDFSIFRIIHIETRTLCNGRCSFCRAAAQFKAREDRLMDEAIFMKVINELSAINYRGRITLYCNNEPLLDPRLFDFLKISRQKCPDALLEIKTNGKILTVEKLKSLVDAGVDWLCINDYTRLGDFKKNIKETISFLKKGGLGSSECKIYIECRKENDVLDNRAGTSPNRNTPLKTLHRFCMRPFEMITVGTNGQIGLCGCDFDFSYVLGNIKDTSLLDVWKGDDFKRIRESMIRNDRSCTPPCKVCDFHSYYSYDLKGEYRFLRWI